MMPSRALVLWGRCLAAKSYLLPEPNPQKASKIRWICYFGAAHIMHIFET
jgi:hypothetical protein